MRNEMTQVIPIPYSGIKSKRGGIRGWRENTGFVYNPKVISPQDLAFRGGIRSSSVLRKKSNSPGTESMGTNSSHCWGMEVIQTP